LLRDIGTQSLRAANKQRVSRPHFQYLDWSKSASRHGQRSYGTSIMQKSAGQRKNKAFWMGSVFVQRSEQAYRLFRPQDTYSKPADNRSFAQICTLEPLGTKNIHQIQTFCFFFFCLNFKICSASQPTHLTPFDSAATGLLISRCQEL
jgi:hypothetical protein